MNRGKERRADRAKVLDDRALALAQVLGSLGPWVRRSLRVQAGQVVRQIKRNPSVAVADRFDAAPDDLAGGNKGVEVRRLIILHSRGKNFGFEHGCRERRTLEVLDRIEQSVESSALAHEPLPAGEQADEYGRLDRLDLLAQSCQRSASDGLEDLRIAPFATRSTRPELPFQKASGGGELLEKRVRRPPASP